MPTAQSKSAEREFFDKFGENKDYDVFENRGYQRIISEFVRYFDPQKRLKVIELGCGTGITTKALLQKFPDAEITGVDYAEEMLMLCEEKFPQVTLLHGDFNHRRFFSFPNRKETRR